MRLAGSVQAVARLEAHLARPEMRRACPRLAAAWDARAPPLPRPLLADLASSVDAAAGTLAPRAFPALAAARKARALPPRAPAPPTRPAARPPSA